MTVVAAIILYSQGAALVRSSLYAQTPQVGIANPDRERGIQFLQQGNAKEAIKALREATKKQKNDAEAWHFLGMALTQNNSLKDARKAFEIAGKLRPNFAPTYYNLSYIALMMNKNAEAIKHSRRAIELDANMAGAHYVLGAALLREGSPERALEEAETALTLKPALAPAQLLRSQALINLYAAQVAEASGSVTLNETTRKANAEKEKQRKHLLRDAADSLEEYLKLAPADSSSKIWREQLETLRVYGGTGKTDEKDSERAAYNGREVMTKARILSKPEPTYTAQARQAGVSGTVILRAVFAADGKVKYILVIRSLPYGLTEQAIRAARKIKFIPATIDDRPVSQFIQIEYNFNLY